MIRVTVGCDIGHMVRPQPPKLKTSGAFSTPSYHLQSNRFGEAAWTTNTAAGNLIEPGPKNRMATTKTDPRLALTAHGAKKTKLYEGLTREQLIQARSE